MKELENFPFNGFINHQSKVPQWQNAAKEILKKINISNIGFVAQTGSGKTIVAFYCLSALKKRTLFLAPTRILCRQHHKFYKQVTDKNDSRVIVGDDSIKSRNWRNLDDNLVFATPHVFLADRKKSLVDISDFDLLIIDECHKASKNYPYVEIAQRFNALNKRIITMSASPGKNKEVIELISNNLKVGKWQKSEIETPKKTNVPIFIPLNLQLLEAKSLIDELKRINIVEIKNLSSFETLLKKSEIDEIKDFIPMSLYQKISQKSEKISGENFYLAKMILAKYLKITHLEGLILTESYYNFLKYLEKLKKQNSKSGNQILLSKQIRKLTIIASSNLHKHPKVEKFLEVLKEEKAKNNQGLIFFSNKEVALYLEKLLKTQGLKSACLFGGQGRSTKKQQAVIKAVKEKEVDFVLATSVVEEGLNVPSFNFVLNYSLPTAPVSQLQRAGRTGRFNEGLVYYLIMEIDYEKIKFFSNFRSLKKMDEIVYKKNKGHYDPDQLSLF